MAEIVERWANLKVTAEKFTGAIQAKPNEAPRKITEVILWLRGDFAGKKCDLFAQTASTEGLCKNLCVGHGAPIGAFDSIEDALDFVFTQLTGSDKEMHILVHASIKPQIINNWMRKALLSPENQFKFDENSVLQSATIQSQPGEK